VLADKKNRIAPMYVGCIVYKIAASPVPHQTGFIYSVEAFNPLDPVHFAGLLEVGKDIKLSDIRMVEHAFGGFYAN
jgi:hypothetical protein